MTVLVAKLRGIEIGEANFDPFIGIGRPANAKAVTVADMADRAAKCRAGSCRQWPLAGVSMGHEWRREREDRRGEKNADHALTLTSGGFGLVFANRARSSYPRQKNESRTYFLPSVARPD